VHLKTCLLTRLGFCKERLHWVLQVLVFKPRKFFGLVSHLKKSPLGSGQVGDAGASSLAGGAPASLCPLVTTVTSGGVSVLSVSSCPLTLFGGSPSV
jgi:hypothetical protein